MSSSMASLAKKTIASNGFDKSNSNTNSSSVTIDIVEGHSCEVSPYHDNTKATLCTSELLESGLLGEGWLPAMRDAHERHLDNENAIVIPQRARVYARVVEGEGVSNYWGPYKILKCNDHSLTTIYIIR